MKKVKIAGVQLKRNALIKIERVNDFFDVFILSSNLYVGSEEKVRIIIICFSSNTSPFPKGYTQWLQILGKVGDSEGLLSSAKEKSSLFIL